MIVKTVVEFTKEELNCLEKAKDIIWDFMYSEGIPEKVYDKAEEAYNDIGEILKLNENV